MNTTERWAVAAVMAVVALAVWQWRWVTVAVATWWDWLTGVVGGLA